MTTLNRLGVAALLFLAASFQNVLAAAGDASAAAMPAQVLSERGGYRIEVLRAPRPLPAGSHFSVRLKVARADGASLELSDLTLSVAAGMRHGREDGFAHGMQSQPEVTREGDLFLVEGLYFHMDGVWTLKVTLEEDGEPRRDYAWLDVPCCGE